MKPRSLARLLLALPMIALLVFQAGAAQAHARYESSDPADKATVSSPPSEVTADFSEPVTADSFLEITDPCGEVVSGGSNPVADKITTSMSGTRAGTYTVYFRVQSTVDSHVTDGTFSFTSSGGDPCPGQEPPRDDSNDPGAPKDGGGSNPRVERAGSTTPGGGSNAASGSGTEPGASDDGDGGRKRDDKRGSGHGPRAGGHGGGESVRLSADERAPERRGPDPWDLPADGLIAGLVIAALIGAAGGRIYANILGPRD